MKIDIIISETLFNQMYKHIDSLKLSEQNRANKFVYKGKFLVFTSFVSSLKKGVHVLTARQAVPLDSYKGELKPLLSNERHLEIMAGKRERGYNAQLVYILEKPFVLIDPEINFYKRETEENQTILF